MALHAARRVATGATIESRRCFAPRGSVRSKRLYERALVVACAAVALAACTESTVIRTNPPDASIYVNERYVGASPAVYETKSWDVRPHGYRYRAVKPGYQQSEGEIPIRLSIGRIIAAYFSACMSCGHGFYVFDEDTVVPLTPEAEPGLTLAPEAP